MVFAASGLQGSAWITTSVLFLCFVFPRATLAASIAVVFVLPSFLTLSLILIILFRRLFLWLTNLVLSLVVWYKHNIQTRWIDILLKAGLLAALLIGLLSGGILHLLSSLHIFTPLAVFWVVMCWILFRLVDS